MVPNRLAFAALAVACVTAAGVGGYVATRHDMPVAEAQEAPAPLAAPVQETEALVSSPAAAPLPAAAPTPAPIVAPVAPAARPRRASASTPAPRSRPADTPREAPAPMPTLERTWPSTSPAPAAPPLEASATPEPAPAPPVEDREPVRAPEPPAKTFTELVVSSDSVIGFQTETALSSERARVEDRVEARVIRDVRVGGEVAIPAGTRALGVVTVVDRGGKFKERARLGIRFQSLVLADGTRLPLTTETIYRYGDAPGNGTAARIGGGAVAGAILGAIIGGSKGAAIGATTGAGAGAASVVAGDRSEATFPAGAEVTARILSPVSVTVERE